MLAPRASAPLPTLPQSTAAGYRLVRGRPMLTVRATQGNYILLFVRFKLRDVGYICL